MRVERSKLSWSFLYLALVITLGSAFSLLNFTYPKADEYFRAGRVRDLGILDSVKTDYFHWTARWSSLALEYAIGKFLPLEKSYGWILFVVALAIIGSIYALLSAVFSQELSRKARGILSLAFFAIYWSGMPSVQETFYWLTGSVDNQLSVALGIFLVAGLVYQSIHWEKKNNFLSAFLVGMAPFVMGTHEFFGSLLCVFLFAGTWIMFQGKYPARYLWIVTTVLATISLIIVVIAPGNAIRMSYIRPPHNFHSFLFTIKVWCGRVISWLDIKLITGTLLLLSLPKFWSLPLPRKNLLLGKTSLVLACISMLILVGVPWWSMGGRLPGRTWSVLYLLFLLAWFTAVFVIARIARPNFQVRSQPVFTVLFFGLSLFFSRNFIAAARDLSGPAKQYQTAMGQRYALIASALHRGERNVRVPKLTSIPLSFNFNADLVEANSTVQNRFVNEHMATYFKLETIALEEKPSTEVSNK